MYLVCDGGGTKTEYLLFDKAGQVHGRSKSVGTNALFTDPTVAAESVCNGIHACLSQAKLASESLSGIALFIPGFGKSLDFVKMQFPNLPITLLGDECNAYYGALGKPGGLTVLAGTGSFAVGKTKAGEWIKAGGWGPLFDDLGSGYHIGVMCLAQVTHLYDLGITDSVLQKKTLEHLDLADVSMIRKAAYQKEFTRAHVASLSRVVAAAAQAGDEYALQIIDRAATALVDLAATASRHFDEGVVPVSLIGGLTGMGAMLIDRFQKNLEERLPRCRYCSPAYSPIVGSALYVMYEMEQRQQLPPEFIQNLVCGMED